MDRKPPPLVPAALPLRDVLGQSTVLASLRQRLQDSDARLEAVRALLPPILAAEVSAGPVDDSGWTLLTRSAAVAAKLRQLRPRLEDALHAAGWQVSAIRIKVQSR